MRKSFPSILLVSLLSLGAATPALASGDAVLMSSGPSCGSFCADVSWIGESALMVIRGERGEIVKVESVDLPRDARLVSSTTTNSEQSELFPGASRKSGQTASADGPGAPAGGTGPVTVANTYQTTTHYVTVSAQFVYVNYQLVSVSVSSSSVAKKDIEEPSTHPK